MKNVHFFIKGMGVVMLFMALLPILLPLFIIDNILWLGGADPMNTPIRKFIDKLPF